MANILVLGGTGFVGRSVCARLVERAGAAGGRITVVTRRLASAKHVQLLPTVDVVEADVHDPVQLQRLVAGRDAVINLVGILHGSEAEFERVHAGLPRQLAHACADHGVRRVIHLSALGAGERAPSRYLRSKGAGEAALKLAHLDLTLLRPSVIFGAADRFINLFAQLQSALPVLPLAGARARFQPVWVEDVALAVQRCLDDPSTIGLTIECVGPQVFTLADLARLAGEWSGHARPVWPVPDALARVQAWILERLPGVPLLSRDNLDSMRQPSVAGDQWPGLERLGIRTRALAAVVPLYLRAAQGPARLNPLRARARRG